MSAGRIGVAGITAGLAPPPAALKARHDVERDERYERLSFEARNGINNILHAIEHNPKSHEIEHATRIEEEATSPPPSPPAAAAAAAGGAGHAAAAPDRTIFAILGHGYETEFDYTKRNILPEGITLVTIVRSGQTSLMPDVCRGVNLLSTVDDKIILNDPANNIDAISKKMLVLKNMTVADVFVFTQIRVHTPPCIYNLWRIGIKKYQRNALKLHLYLELGSCPSFWKSRVLFIVL